MQVIYFELLDPVSKDVGGGSTVVGSHYLVLVMTLSEFPSVSFLVRHSQSYNLFSAKIPGVQKGRWILATVIYALNVSRKLGNYRLIESLLGAALPLYVTDSSDQGYYKIGAGGTIRQIIFANEDDASGTWLAVRQSTTTTIFRIVYTSSQEYVDPETTWFNL
jgi:hypothetical protein